MNVYDYILVGGGTSAAVLAARLSQAADKTVLILEAGADYVEATLPAQLRLTGTLTALSPGSPYNWGFFGRTDSAVVPVVRGRVVGGGSTVNGAGYTRPLREELEQWEAIGKDDWSVDRLSEILIAVENDFDFPGGEHGDAGPIPVARVKPSALTALSRAVIAGCLEAGFGEDEDMNAFATGEGVGRIPMNSVDGVRKGTLLTYLEPVRHRPNLIVWGGSFVRRILFDGKRAIGVEVERDSEISEVHGREIILCAGAIKTPHILMLSGIGPAAQLRANGIPIVRDLPGVGQNFQDHPGADVTYLPRPFAIGPDTPMAEVMLHYTASGSPLASDMEMIFMTMPFAKAMSAGRTGGRALGEWLRHLSGLVSAGLRLGIGSTIRMRRSMASLIISCRIMAEYSKGSSTLVSADPHVLPNYNFRSFSDPRDVARLVDCVRNAVRILDSRAMKPFVKRRLTPTDAVLVDNEALAHWIRTGSPPYAHTTGSCRMGPASDPDSVVDSQCRVHGVEHLRIVDLSICPVNSRRGPAAAAVMLAERAACLIAGWTAVSKGKLASPSTVIRETNAVPAYAKVRSANPR